MRVGWYRHGPAELGTLRRVPLLVKASACPSLRLLAALLGAGGHQNGPEQHHPVGCGRHRGGVRSPAPLAGQPRSLDLCLSDAVRCAGVPAGRGAGGGSRRPHQGSAPASVAQGSGPMGPAPFDDGGEAAPPLPRRVPGHDPGVGHRPDHAGEKPGRVETTLPSGGSTMCGIGGLHGPRGPPHWCCTPAARPGGST